MICQIVPFDCKLQKYILSCYLDTKFQANCMFLDCDCNEKSTNDDYCLQKINNSHDLQNRTILPSA